MPAADVLLAFFGISVLLCLTPGPDNVFVLLQSALHGRRAGLSVVLGLCTGLLVHTSAVALGLAALVAASETAFTVLKLAGAAYLLWLAWQSFRAPAGPLVGHTEAPGLRRMLLRGVAMNLSNPKVTIFFLAFLPQFVDRGRGGTGEQVLWLGAVFIAATLLTFGAIAVSAASFGHLLQRSVRAQRALNWAAGLVFAGLAVRLAMAQR